MRSNGTPPEAPAAEAPPRDRLGSLIAGLRALKLEPEPTWEEIADVIWLAAHLPQPDGAAEAETAGVATPVGRRPPPPPPVVPPPPPTKTGPTEADRKGQESAARDGEGDSGAPVHVPSGADGPALGRGLPLRVPAAPALPGALEIARALRPLMRRVPSPREKVFDEEATVRRIADEGVWVPVLSPAPSRWFEVALVADTATSMAVWQPTLTELCRLLERQGAFRDVRLWKLDTHAPETRLPLYAGTRSAPHRPEELIDAAGRRLILVATDCVAAPWRDGRARALIESWARRQPVAILQMLPQTLWRQTGLGTGRRIRVRAEEAGVPNTRLWVRDGAAWLSEAAKGGMSAPNRVPVPVVTLDADALRAWARLVTQSGDVTAPAFLLGQGATPRAAPARDRDAASEARERLSRFRALASPTALQLARLLTVTPLRLPIMRLVQQTLLPRSRQLHLAEFLLGGLIRRSATPPVPAGREDGPLRRDDPEAIVFEWYPHVQDLLLDTLPVPDAVQVYNQVFRAASRYLEERLGQPLDFQAIIADPEGPGSLMLAEHDPAFAAIMPKILRRLGGRYSEAADRLEKAHPATVPPPVEPPQKTPGLTLRALLRPQQGVLFRLAWSPDGSTLATPSVKGVVSLWSDPPAPSQPGTAVPAIEQPRDTLFVSDFGANQVAWSPDGTRLAVASYDHLVRVFELPEKRRIARLTNHASDVRTVAWSPDGRRLATGSKGGTVRLFSTRTWERRSRLKLPKGPINIVAWSPDSARIAFGCDDGAVGVVDRDEFSTPGLLPGHAGRVLSLCWHPRADRLLSGASNGEITVWDLDPGSPQSLVARLVGHTGQITAISISADGRFIASKATDHTVRLWDGMTYSLLHTIEEPSSGHPYPGLAFHPRRPALATLAENDTAVRIWDLNPSSLLAAATAPRQEAAPQPQGGRWAVLIGVNEAADLEMTPARYCDRDIYALTEALPRGGYALERIVTLIGRSASRANILARLERVCRAAGPEGLLWLHVSGYGAMVDNEPVLATYDTTASDLLQTGLAVGRLIQQVREWGSPRLILTLDAGTRHFVARAADIIGEVAFFACGYAVSSEVQHGVLTYLLLGALGAGVATADSGYLMPSDLEAYIREGQRLWEAERERLSPLEFVVRSGSDRLLVFDTRSPAPQGLWAEETPTAAGPSTDPTSALRPAVLWLDDSPGGHLHERVALEARGVSTTYASTLEDAAERAREERFQAIVFALMPGPDRISAIRRLSAPPSPESGRRNRVFFYGRLSEAEARVWRAREATEDFRELLALIHAVPSDTPPNAPAETPLVVPSAVRRLYEALQHLGYRDQKQVFRETLERRSHEVFVVHGPPEHGQNWLANVLARTLVGSSSRTWITHEVAADTAAAASVPLMMRVAQALGATPAAEWQTTLAEQIADPAAGDWLLLIHDIHLASPEDLEELIYQFWGNEVLPRLGTAPPQSAHPRHVLMLLVDGDGSTTGREGIFAVGSRAVGRFEPTRLPRIHPFSLQELYQWLAEMANALPTELSDQPESVAKQIYEESRGGIPERVFASICDRCSVDWQEVQALARLGSRDQAS